MYFNRWLDIGTKPDAKKSSRSFSSIGFDETTTVDSNGPAPQKPTTSKVGVGLS
jgi:hypothetical protein